MTDTIITLCRPDEGHYCVECCRPRCPLLGALGDGTQGCLGHDGKQVSMGIAKTSYCSSVNCLDGFSQEDRQTLRVAISRLPKGEFKMGRLFKQLGAGNVICAWCNPQRVIGKQLGLYGDSHGICEECSERVFDDYLDSRGGQEAA